VPELWADTVSASSHSLPYQSIEPADTPVFVEIQPQAQPASGPRPCGCEISGSAPRRVGYRGRGAVDERPALGGCCRRGESSEAWTSIDLGDRLYGEVKDGSLNGLILF